MSEQSAKLPGFSGLRLTFRQSLLETEGSVRTGRFRGVRTSGLLLASSAILSVLLVTWLGAGDIADVVALRLLAYASWLYGLLGLPALLGEERRKGSAAGLAVLRGMPARAPGHRVLGLTLRLLMGLLVAALPGIVVAAALSPAGATLLVRGALVLLSTAYLAALASCLAVVGVAAENLSPQRPRWIALSLVLVPFGLSFQWDNIPSLPGLFLWAFDGLVRWGGLAS